LASIGFGATSLAIGFVANYAVNLLVVLAAVRRDLRWRRAERTDLRRFVAYGLRMTLLRLIDYCWVQLPQLVGGYTANPAALGLYNRAQYVADFAFQTTVWRVTAVLFPVFAGMADERERIARLVPPVTALYAILILPACAWVAVFADMLLALLLGPPWAQGGTVLSLLIFAFGLWTLNHPAGCVLEALGWLRSRFVAGLLAPGVFLILITILGGGVHHLATAALVSSIVPLLLNGLYLWRQLGIGGIGAFASTMAPGGVVMLVMAATMLVLRQSVTSMTLHPAAVLLAGLAVAGPVYLLAIRALVPAGLRDTIQASLPARPSGMAAIALHILGLRPGRSMEAR
jgi:PST family polysaccharide transporter